MENETILKKAGFVELPKRDIWISKIQRKAFSHAALRDHDPQWLQERLREQVEQGQFVFYFNRVAENFAKESVRILSEVGADNLQPVLSKRTLVIGPFDSNGSTALETVRKALNELGHEVIRLDQIPSGALWANATIDAVRTSDFVVFDVSGRNPNVYYELGLAHGLRKPTILLVSYKSDDSIPSDLSGFQYLVYDPEDMPSLSVSVKRAARKFATEAQAPT
jgi:hypothetical protein